MVNTGQLAVMEALTPTVTRPTPSSSNSAANPDSTSAPVTDVTSRANKTEYSTLRRT